MAPIEIRAADAAKGAAMHWTTGLALGLPTLLVVLVGAWLFMWNVRQKHEDALENNPAKYMSHLYQKRMKKLEEAAKPRKWWWPFGKKDTETSTTGGTGGEGVTPTPAELEGGTAGIAAIAEVPVNRDWSKDTPRLPIVIENPSDGHAKPRAWTMDVPGSPPLVVFQLPGKISGPAAPATNEFLASFIRALVGKASKE